MEFQKGEDGRYHFVYLTTNLINGKHYLGKHSTSNLKDRYLGSGKIISQAIKKHGNKNFKCKVLMQFSNEVDAYRAERLLGVIWKVRENKNFYNLTDCGTGALSCKRSPESVAKGADKIRGKKQPPELIEKRIRSRIENNSFIWKQEAKDRFSQKMKGKVLSEETKRRMSKSKKGRTFSDETLKKLSEASKKWHKEFGHSQESKNKISKANKGRIATTETKEKMKESAKLRIKLICPYCDRELDKGNYVKLHGEKCKFKKDE